jgi:hypothetical protein
MIDSLISLAAAALVAVCGGSSPTEPCSPAQRQTSPVFHDQNRTGPPLDNSSDQISELGLRMLRPDRRDEHTRNGNLGGVRQWIESIFDTERPARTLAAAIWHNWATGAHHKRNLTPHDH